MDQDFVKEGPNSSLIYASITQLAFTAVMPNLYRGKEVQNQAYVDQRKNYKTLIKRVKRISHMKSAEAESVRSG